MKIYNRKDFAFGIIMFLTVPGRILDGLQQWNEGEAGGLLWVAVVLAIAAKYFYSACSKAYNEINPGAKDLRQRAGQRRFGRLCGATETAGLVMVALSVISQFAIPEIGHTVSVLLLLFAVVYIIWFERAIQKTGRKIQLEEAGEQ